MTDDKKTGNNLREVALLFLKLGVVAFGGPAAHIAMMRDEVVRRRNWVGDQDFLDMIGATNLIPGPNSTELAIHLGHRRAGWVGLITAGALFMPMMYDLFNEPYDIRDGTVYAPRRPGLGFTLRDDVFDRFKYAPGPEYIF